MLHKRCRGVDGRLIQGGGPTIPPTFVPSPCRLQASSGPPPVHSSLTQNSNRIGDDTLLTDLVSHHAIKPRCLTRLSYRDYRFLFSPSISLFNLASLYASAQGTPYLPSTRLVTATMSAIIDPTKAGKYPVVLSDALLGGPGKNVFTDMRCTFYPFSTGPPRLSEC